MRRRELLQFGGGALIPATLLAQGRVSAPGQAKRQDVRRLPDVDLQLSTVTRLLAQDFEGTLRQVAEFGSLDQVKRNIEYINAAARFHQSC